MKSLPVAIYARVSSDQQTDAGKEEDRGRTPEERTAELSGWSLLLCSALSPPSHSLRTPEQLLSQLLSRDRSTGSAGLTTLGRLPDNRLR
jgi:hypothetical protein